MKVIDPADLELLQSSVPEDDAPLWDAAVSFGADDQVILDHVVYASLIDDNTGKNPLEWSTGTDAAWRKVGPTNRYACLDEYVNTRTVAPEGADTLTLKVSFNRCTGFALLNFKATEIRVVVRDGDGEIVLDARVSTLKDVGGWWEYYFLPIERVVDFVRMDVPVSALADLEVTLIQEGGPELGHIVAGQTWFIGTTLYSAQGGQRDYSRKETDEFGNTRLIARSVAKRMSLPLYLHPSRIDAVHQRLARLSGRPALWIGDNRDSERGGHQSLTVWGWLEDWRDVFVGPNEVSLAVDIQGLI